MKRYKTPDGVEDHMSETPNGEWVKADVAQKLYDNLKEATNIIESILEDPAVCNVNKCHVDKNDLKSFKKVLDES